MTEYDNLKLLIDKIEKEQEELGYKLTRLELRIHREEVYPKMSELQFNLITAQYGAMNTYHNILTMRLNDLDEQLYDLTLQEEVFDKDVA